VNRYKTDWKVLRYIAERSPKHFATQIRKRNQGLLDALNRKQWGFHSYVGCPHCYRCYCCLWTKAVHDFSADACCQVRFGGSQLFEQKLVEYHPTWEVLINYTDFDRTEAQIAKSRRFLEAHIAWTKKPYWGRKVERT